MGVYSPPNCYFQPKPLKTCKNWIITCKKLYQPTTVIWYFYKFLFIVGKLKFQYFINSHSLSFMTPPLLSLFSLFIFSVSSHFWLGSINGWVLVAGLFSGCQVRNGGGIWWQLGFNFNGGVELVTGFQWWVISVVFGFQFRWWSLIGVWVSLVELNRLLGWDWWWVVLLVARLGLVVVVSMVGGLGLVAGFWWQVVSLFVVCGATVMVGGFGGGGCWVGILVVRDDGCLERERERVNK